MQYMNKTSAVYHAIITVILASCVIGVSAEHNALRSPQYSFEYAPSTYYYRETVLSEASDSNEVFMSLTSSPIVHGLTGIMKRYMEYDWYTQSDLSIILGNVDYDSSGTGSVSGQDNFILVLQNTINHCWTNTWCVGSGYGFRYLDNDSKLSVTSTGSFGYERENYLHYLPITLTTNQLVRSQFVNRVQLQAKWYYLLDGNQISRLKQLGCQSDLSNRQSSGYGVELTSRFYDNARKWYYGISGQHWHIDDSDMQRVSCFDQNIYANEPENRTTMASIIVGYQP